MPRVQEVAEEVGWLAAAGGGADTGPVPSPGDPYFSRCLDYAAEDGYLASLAAR